MKNYAELIPVLKEIVMLAKKKDITIGEVLQKLDHYGFSLIALLLVLPFMQPFPVGPLSVLGGMTFTALGWQILQKKPTPMLPKKILTLRLSEKNWSRITRLSIFIITLSQKITKPRLRHLVNGSSGLKFEGGIMVTGGVLMAIPFGVLPLNNFFPGLAILFITLAQFEEDGLFILIAIFWLIFSVFYFSIFFFGIYLLGLELIHYLPDWMANLV